MDYYYGHFRKSVMSAIYDYTNENEVGNASLNNCNAVKARR
jgi:hypothetical protein